MSNITAWDSSIFDASVYSIVCINVLNFTAFNYSRNFDKFKIFFSRKTRKISKKLYPSGLGNFQPKNLPGGLGKLEMDFSQSDWEKICQED